MGNCNDVVFYLTLTAEIEKGGGSAVIDMEERFCSVSLDIIGLAVFNYDFGSTTRESPIIKAVYTCLQEAAHRSTFYFPYWNLPLATLLVSLFYGKLDGLMAIRMTSCSVYRFRVSASSRTT